MLATNVGGIPKIVTGTDTMLLPPEDAEALAEAMLEVLGHPAAARASALRLQQAVGRRFTVTAMTDEVLDLYDTVLAEICTRPSLRLRHRVWRQPSRSPYGQLNPQPATFVEGIGDDADYKGDTNVSHR